MCDAVSEPTQGGHAAHSTGVTVIAGPPDSHGARAGHARLRAGVLVDFANERGSSTWLLWDGKRSQIDLANHAVTNALGWVSTCPRRGPSRRGCSTRSRKLRR